MWEYLAVLLIGFWLGVAIFLYVSCHWLEEILDLPQRHSEPGHSHTLGASGAHAQLKRLVARVVEEASALPALAQYAAEPQTPTESSTYEDLLATAILNKVIERYQTENGSGGRSSGIHSASASPSPSDRSSPRSLHSRATRDITPTREDDASDWEEGEATDDALEVPRRVPFPEYGGDIVHATDNDYREFDEVSGSDIQAIDGSWEENWLFQKKKIKNIQSAPVPMLVPNSNTQYRALIGDRDAEDTTDLSDNASDVEEQDIEYKSDVKKVLDSKHVIGGKAKVDEVLDFEPDSLTIIDESQNIVDSYSDRVISEDTVDFKQPDIEINNDINNGTITNEIHNDNHDSILLLDVDSGPLSKTEFNLKEEIHRTIMNGHANYSDNNLNGNLIEEYDDQKPLVAYNKGTVNTLSRFEREKEYEETVTVPVQRYADSLRRKHFEEPQLCSIPSTEENDLIPGSIAYRERKKWLNFVDMPNNPYSPEAIKKRLSAKSTSSLFDTLTTNKDRDTEKLTSCENVCTEQETKHNSMKEIVGKRQLKTSLSIDEGMMDDRRSISPSPKVLRNVLSEDLPNHKRYGRDYYIKEARSSSGERKGKSSISGSSSLSSSINKSTSLDNFDREFASPVSACSSLSDLEAAALHTSLPRAVLSPRHASPNFAINPIFENPDSNALDYGNDGRKTTPNITHTNGDNDFEENEVILRLKIPQKPEVTEDLFETYTDVRRSGTLRSDDFYKLVGLLIQQFNTIATHQQYTNFENKNKEQISITTMPSEYKNEIMIDYEDVNEHTLFVKPTYTDDDTDQKFEEILQTAYNNTDKFEITTDKMNDEADKYPTSLENSLSSSSVEDSIKIYNVQTGEIVKCTPEDKLSRRSVADKNDNINIPDKNTAETIAIIDRLSESENSAINLVEIDSFKEAPIKSEIEDLPAELPNVKELAKKFVSMESLSEPVKVPQPVLKRHKSKENIFSSDYKEKSGHKLQYMHSLTARSISKEFREELKLSMATPHTVPGGAKDIPEGEEVTRESSRPGSPVPEPGTIKSKLAFFESLKSKFTSK
ncbi:jg10984 [Pararge aegeria aegeria]|uniref:Jg10984 protein n=1 Tax=Pararge aegeria aegeria TaxID=348720 RepID=A0A8S4SCX6_9NEOP|nr:jg10984 [Pararge aegeria aegeria]